MREMSSCCESEVVGLLLLFDGIAATSVSAIDFDGDDTTTTLHAAVATQLSMNPLLENGCREFGSAERQCTFREYLSIVQFDPPGHTIRLLCIENAETTAGKQRMMNVNAKHFISRLTVNMANPSQLQGVILSVYWEKTGE